MADFYKIKIADMYSKKRPASIARKGRSSRVHLLFATQRPDAAFFDGGELSEYKAPTRRWGSVLGIQPDGLEVFAPNGRAFRFPAWSFERVLMPWIVARGIYRGIRTR